LATVIHQERARRLGWFVIAGFLAIIAIAPDTELGIVGRGCVLTLASTSLGVALSRRSRSVSLDRARGTLSITTNSLLGTSERRLPLSDLTSVDCVKTSVGGEEGDGQLQIGLKSGENVVLASPLAAFPSANEDLGSLPFRAAKAIHEALDPRRSG
jgi:hypothetical protein